MKPRPFDYIRPDTVEEALDVLAEQGEDARILAGGQTLIAMPLTPSLMWRHRPIIILRSDRKSTRLNSSH